MNIRYKPVLLILILCIRVCHGNSQSPATVLRIDPSLAIGGKLSEIFDSISYTPLETIPESVFGKIDQLEITDDYYVILDYDTNSILFFFKNGRFHCKIKGNAIARTSRPFGIAQFAVNRQRKELFFKLDSVTMGVYDFNGEKLREQKSLPSYYHAVASDDVQIYSAQEFPKDTVAESTTYELKWVRNDRVIRTDLPYPVKPSTFIPGDMIRSMDSHFYHSGSDTTFYYTKPYDYTVYQVGPASCTPVYSFIIPAGISLPADFSSSLTYKGHRVEYIMRGRKGVVFVISHVYQVGHLLFFELETLGDNRNSSLIYNLNSGLLIGINHIEPDTSNHLLPVFHNQGSVTFAFSSRNFLTADSSCIYTSASAIDMLSVPNIRADQGLKNNPPLYNYFRHVVRTDNPVIIRLRPKQGM